MASIASVSHAQTIGEFTALALPPPVPPSQNPPPGGVDQAQAKAGTFLVGIFTSKDSAQAEFAVDGRAQYYSVGDRFKDGWIIDKINPASVEFKKCRAAKSCDRKTIFFSGM